MNSNLSNDIDQQFQVPDLTGLMERLVSLTATKPGSDAKRRKVTAETGIDNARVQDGLATDERINPVHVEDNCASNEICSNEPLSNELANNELANKELQSNDLAKSNCVDGPSSRSRGPTDQRMIDWNIQRPEGTLESLQALLKSIDECFQATVFLGCLSRAGHVKYIYGSESAWIALKRKPLWLRNMLVEAAHSNHVVGSQSTCGTLTSVMAQANRELGSKAVLGFSSTIDMSQAAFGCVLAFRQTLTATQAEGLSLTVQQLATELAEWLRCWHDNYTVRRWHARCGRFLRTLRASPKNILLVVFGVSLLLCLPLPYWPKRACVLEPTIRQYVSSPMDGRVLESLVKPGDTVTQGQVLARLDDEELRWSLVSAQAEYEATAKKRDIGLASNSSGNMRVAQLELEQIALRIEAIQANMDRLIVRSPIDGIVLQGDWFRSQGAPVSRGDTLFEVAPLDRMTVETHLSTEDLAQIRVGHEATLRVDSHRENVWQGKLERIDPRAKIIDESVVFVAELEIEGGVNELKPGMKGTVTLSSGTRSLGWLLFQRPYQWLLKKLLW